MIQITNRAILPQEVLDALETDVSGSVVVHIGIVRPSSGGTQVSSILYQIDEKRATQELSEIAEDIRSRWHPQDVALVRRTGKLKLGETILVAGISAEHREEAFEACQFAVERLRKMDSVNKREIYE